MRGTTMQNAADSLDQMVADIRTRHLAQINELKDDHAAELADLRAQLIEETVKAKIFAERAQRAEKEAGYYMRVAVKLVGSLDAAGDVLAEARRLALEFAKEETARVAQQDAQEQVQSQEAAPANSEPVAPPIHAVAA